MIRASIVLFAVAIVAGVLGGTTGNRIAWWVAFGAFAPAVVMLSMSLPRRVAGAAPEKATRSYLADETAESPSPDPEASRSEPNRHV